MQVCTYMPTLPSIIGNLQEEQLASIAYREVPSLTSTKLRKFQSEEGWMRLAKDEYIKQDLSTLYHIFVIIMYAGISSTHPLSLYIIALFLPS